MARRVLGGGQAGDGHRLGEAWAQVRRAQAVHRGSRPGTRTGGGRQAPALCPAEVLQGLPYPFHTERGSLCRGDGWGPWGKKRLGLGISPTYPPISTWPATAPTSRAGLPTLPTGHPHTCPEGQSRGCPWRTQCPETLVAAPGLLFLPLSLLSLSLSLFPIFSSLFLFASFCLSFCLSFDSLLHACLPL